MALRPPAIYIKCTDAPGKLETDAETWPDSDLLEYWLLLPSGRDWAQGLRDHWIQAKILRPNA